MSEIEHLTFWWLHFAELAMNEVSANIQFFSTYPQNVKKKKKEVSANIGLWRRHLRRVPVPAAERALRDGRRARVGRRLRGHRCSLEGTANFGRGVYVKIIIY